MKKIVTEDRIKKKRKTNKRIAQQTDNPVYEKMEITTWIE